MQRWPDELIRFVEQQAPLYIHLAAALPGAAPFVCRGYGLSAELRESDRIRVHVLKSQWARVAGLLREDQPLAVLATSGLDNESYQLKGKYAGCRASSEELAPMLDRQRRIASLHFPHLVSLTNVKPSDCLAVGIDIAVAYEQTPGPGAGSLLAERREPS